MGIAERQLPAAYQQVEWIEPDYSYGYPYIDTETAFYSPDPGVEIKYKINKFYVAMHLLSGRNENIWVAPQEDNLFVCVNYAGIRISTQNEYTVKELKLEKGHVYMNGSYFADYDVGIVARYGTFRLFRYYGSDSGDTYSFGGRLYYLRIYERGTTRINLVPCYRKSDREPGMYDLVNRIFYQNAGTGEFAVGPDVN